MSSGNIEPTKEVLQAEKVDILHDEVLANPELMNEAFDGENREHEEGLWTAAKSHTWACFWAFIMCFTIVSLLPHIRVPPQVPGPQIANLGNALHLWSGSWNNR